MVMDDSTCGGIDFAEVISYYGLDIANYVTTKYEAVGFTGNGVIIRIDDWGFVCREQIVSGFGLLSGNFRKTLGINFN